ncbi:hypothetical protein JOC86_003807 [Bacillus pakistanensis]|uniref:Uncharacterized protein n=1 Tax=Rossellomorea pakistanensis TaxID=992288 RepID=A0ABS2NHC8_9BACI|nr:hypothetical protein [Bacillus pakistanensis]MBM7587234.1 hypothetical protein [Bacillus pakistanensis]
MGRKKAIVVLVLFTLLFLVVQLFTGNGDLNYPFIFLGGGIVGITLMLSNPKGKN